MKAMDMKKRLVTAMILVLMSMAYTVVSAIAEQNSGKINPSEVGETYIGGVVADAMLTALDADMALINGGSLGFGDLPDKLDEKTVIKIVPYDTDLVVAVKLKGNAIRQILEKSCQQLPRRSSAFLQVAGISFTCDINKEPGSRVSGVKVGGKVIVPENDYIVATTEFLASGGGGLAPFRSGKIISEEGAPIGGVVLDNAKYDKKKIGSLPGRIRIIEKEE
jgi:5'-nucleotidase / UDP-sugar diphosphatase